MIGKRTAVWWALRLGLGLGALLAGLDKFFHVVGDWGAYPGPMHVFGAIEIVLGLLILAGLTRVGGYLLAASLVVFALLLATTGRFYDVAVGGVALSLAAFTLARLTALREEAEISARPEALAHAAVCGLWTDHAHVADSSRGLHS